MVTMKRLPAVLTCSVVALVLAGCATPGAEGTRPAADASAAELGAAFAHCGPNDELSVTADDFLGIPTLGTRSRP